MLSKDIIKNTLSAALSSKGDFAEVFVDDHLKNNIVLSSGKVESLASGRDYGIGIRIIKGLKSVYAYTNDDSLTSLTNTAKKAAEVLGNIEDREDININLVESHNVNRHPIIFVPAMVDTSKKIDKMKLVYSGAVEHYSEISQATVRLLEEDQRVLIANSDGLFTEDRRVRSRIFVNTIASNGVDNQLGSRSPGAMMGFEFFDMVDLEELGKDAAESAVIMLNADYCPAGRIPVVIENGFGGVIFHEACGHSLEATGVAKGNSIFAGKIGEQIASPKVTAIDDGTLSNQWGSLTIDDEGMLSRKNVLIENGVLKSYMIDKLNGKRMGMAPTGNGRRQSYRFAPTSRMTNTYIANGNDDNEDIIRSIAYGLYARRMGGGSVNTITGDFNFSVIEGYMIRNGSIDMPVRGASLIGNGIEILKNIDMVGKNLDYGQGMCSSISGSIPTNVGQPLIRVNEITVGGR